MTSRFFSRRGLIALLGVIGLLAACGPALPAATLPHGPNARAAQDATPTLPAQDPPPDTQSILEQTLIPPRDRIDLAKRLLGVTNIPEPPTQAPPEREIGYVETFKAENLDEDYSFEAPAVLVYKTPHVYMFVEQGYDVDLNAIQHSADDFEKLILPRVHAVFGSEWDPGIDGDPHLYIVHLTRLGQTAAAYYASESEYPQEAVSSSNEHEMFYVNLDNMARFIGTDYYESVLAHEFQHMIHNHVDENEDLWINEGLSEVAAMIAGYGASYFANNFLATPNIQLNTWPEDEGQPLHYGAAYLFLTYFYQRYGEEATKALVRDPANGLTSVQETLDAVGAKDPTTGAPVSLVDLFADWLVTNLVQDTSLRDGRYGYTFPEMAGLPKAQITGEITPGSSPVEGQAPQWGAEYLQISGSSQPQTYRFSFSGSETVSLVPTQAHSGQYMWWANRADESDTRLTRAVDLSGVSQATLKFWTWYYIEDRWDYGYVMVSTDNGATWTPLETRRTTREDPHGNAYGPGYTGQSRGWVQETVDLSAYAGQSILLRFEYITDDAVTQPGFIIDDISIPQIGFSDDAEGGDNGWTSEGWLRMDNTLRQPFLVQLVQPGNTTSPVTRLLGPADGAQGEWEITVGGTNGSAILVIAGLAPVTTEPARYQYRLAPAG